MTALILLACTYFGRMFFITAGYHRYFSHRSYRLGRVAQFVFAFGGMTSRAEGAAVVGRRITATTTSSPTPSATSTRRRDGFWWSHVGWILCDKYGATPIDDIKDFAKYPELRWMNAHDWIGPWSLGVVCWLIGGWSGLVVGFFASTVLLWHSTFLVNSLAHVFGRGVTTPTTPAGTRC